MREGCFHDVYLDRERPGEVREGPAEECGKSVPGRREDQGCEKPTMRNV